MCFSHGLMIGRRRHGWALFAVMLMLVLGGFAVAWWAETSINPVTGLSAWMEGKETRFGVIIPVLGIAGGMARKRVAPPNPGVFPTDTAGFVVILTGSILIVGMLTFFPVLMLGPVVEHFLMLAGRTF